MSNEKLKTYYADLLISQYRNKPRSRATIKALADQFLVSQLPEKIQNVYDIETVSGVSLDIIAKYAGIFRNVNLTNKIPDSFFRIMAKMAILKNSSNSDLYTIKKILKESFNPGEISIVDYKNMKVRFSIDSQLISQQLLQLLIGSDLLFRPMGVRLSIFYLKFIDKIFTFRNYLNPSNNSIGFNSYSNNISDSEFLNYNSEFYKEGK